MGERITSASPGTDPLEEHTTESQTGDVVMLKEVDTNRRLWPLARIIKTYPGEDGLTRVADVFCAGKTCKTPIHKLVLLVSEEEPPDHLRGEDVQASKALSKD